MKRIFTLCLMAGITSFALLSCNGDHKNDTSGTSADSTMMDTSHNGITTPSTDTTLHTDSSIHNMDTTTQKP